MTVKELRDALSQCPDDALVLIEVDGRYVTEFRAPSTRLPDVWAHRDEATGRTYEGEEGDGQSLPAIQI